MEKPFNLSRWIEDHKHLLKPPVGNQQVYKDNEDFIVMVIGGPNARKDFHYNEGEELYYQYQGTINLKIRKADKVKDIPIREGEMFLLEGKVPHLPQRGADTIGLVIERYRKKGEKDGFIWYCEHCGEILYQEYLEVHDIVNQLKTLMEKFYQSEKLRTCNNCGEIMEPPQ